MEFKAPGSWHDAMLGPAGEEQWALVQFRDIEIGKILIVRLRLSIPKENKFGTTPIKAEGNFCQSGIFNHCGVFYFIL